MSKQAQYLKLASLNKIIVEGRDRVDEQQTRVMMLADLPDCRDAVVLLQALQRSMRLVSWHRAKLVEELVGGGTAARRDGVEACSMG